MNLFHPVSALVAAGLFLSSIPARAQKVWNVNFHNQITTSENFVGAAPENTANSTWNKIGGGTNSLPVTGMALADSTGVTAAGVTINLSAIHTTPVSSLTNTNNQTLLSGPKIFNGWIGAQYKQTTFTLNGLIPGTTYDLVVYSDWWWKNGDPLAVSQTTGTGMTGITFIDRPVTGFTNGNVTGLSQDTNPANNTSTTGNWYRIAGLTPNASGQLGFLVGDQPGDGNLGNSAFNGFQLVEMSGGPPDTTAPAPSPMTWSSPPAAAGSSSITMTATTATDPGGVEYFFDETSGNPGGTDSGWQNSPIYTDTGLNPSTSYTYTVIARDKSPAQNPTTASAPATTTTSAASVSTVWNVQIASQAGNQITTTDNFIGAATENTANSTWNRVASVPQTAMVLKKSDGANTGVTLDFPVGSIGTQNLTSGDKIFNSRVNGNNTMTLKGLSVTNSYDIVIYSDWWWKNGDSLPITQTAGTGLVGTFYLNRILSGTYGTVPALTRDTNPADVTSGAGNTGNWMRVNGLSPTLAGELAFRITDGNNTPFNGFQLIATPIPPRADIISLSLASNPPSIRDAVISGTTITLTVPFGTNVTSLAPTYVLWPGATCTTPSGTARNFTTPQTYTVTSSDSLVTKNYSVSVVIAPPLPEFTLSAPANWNGRTTITAQPVISNLTLLQANNGTNFTYNWSASNVAVTQTTSPSVMTLTHSQGSGSLLVTLTLNNGTENVTRSTIITVQEPATDPWVERTPLANEKPVAGQFFARNPFTNLGTVFYRGTQSGTPDDVFLKVYRTPSGGSESLYVTLRQSLTSGAYDFTAQIEAGLFTYRVVYGTRTSGIDTDLATVNNLLCGDAFIIEGQSNAQATDTGTTQEDISAPWVKTYDASLGWGPAYARPTSPNWGSKVGFWGMKLAQDIVAQHSMPVCLINGAVGGTYIAQHQPNPANHTVGAGTYDIYANLLNRVIAARLTHGIRGVFWHQGESDASTFGPPVEPDHLSYEQNFLSMSSAWKQDFPNFQRYVVFQIAPNPCGIGPFASEIREVQRQLPRLYSNMSLVNSIAVPGYEGCHYTIAGYQSLASRVLPVVKRDFYGVTYSAAVTPPNLVRAWFTSSARTAIALQFDQPMSWSSFSLPNWYVNDVANQVTSGSASGNIITLQLSSAADANSTLDYVKDTWSHTESVSTLIYGANTIPALMPALTFANVSIGSLTPYEAWSSSKNLSGPASAGDADPDNDGVENAIEFVLGGEPNPASPGSNSSALLPVSTRNPAGDLIFTFKRKTESIAGVNLTFQWSSDLAFTLPNSITIGAGNSSFDGVQVSVTSFNASTHNIVVTVPAAKAAGGKLFGRLQATTL